MLRITSPLAALLFLLISALLLASCESRDGTSVTSDSAQSMPIHANKSVVVSELHDFSAGSIAVSDATSAEEYSPITENEFVAANTEPLSTFAIDVDAASYSNMRRFVNDRSLPPPDAVRVEEFVNYFDYDYPQPSGAEPFSVTTEVSECPWNPSHRLLHVGLQGRRMQSEQLPPSNLT
ncbi:MAG: von Willebrand factor type A domain-containing protein, partial [bacterium]|nr:von Willebrand factor type A domain-containing protein [Candidatus Kapabacteria bacterium]